MILRLGVRHAWSMKNGKDSQVRERGPRAGILGRPGFDRARGLVEGAPSHLPELETSVPCESPTEAGPQGRPPRRLTRRNRSHKGQRLRSRYRPMSLLDTEIAFDPQPHLSSFELSVSSHANPPPRPDAVRMVANLAVVSRTTITCCSCRPMPSNSPSSWAS